MSEKRKLAAALACRVGGGRLYGKPLQTLDVSGYTILDLLIDGLKKSGVIDEIVLGISEGEENRCFIDVAHKHNISYILGSEKDVLFRLIQCGRAAAATDVYRITPECPFAAWELLDTVWGNHVANGNDITVTDYMAEGLNYEIYSLDALERSHANGNDAERSEFCSAYPRNHPDEFKIEIVAPEKECQRMDLRLTVDWPEDLVVCRKVYDALKDKAPHIPVKDIIAFLDENPHLTESLEAFIDTNPLWASVVESQKAA